MEKPNIDEETLVGQTILLQRLNAKKITVKGSGIKGGIVGQAAKFEIDVGTGIQNSMGIPGAHLSPGDVDVTIHKANSKIPILSYIMQPMMKFFHLGYVLPVMYEVDEPGEYIINIRMRNGDTVAKSPYKALFGYPMKQSRCLTHSIIEAYKVGHEEGSYYQVVDSTDGDEDDPDASIPNGKSIEAPSVTKLSYDDDKYSLEVDNMEGIDCELVIMVNEFILHSGLVFKNKFTAKDGETSKEIEYVLVYRDSVGLEVFYAKDEAGYKHLKDVISNEIGYGKLVHFKLGDIRQTADLYKAICNIDLQAKFYFPINANGVFNVETQTNCLRFCRRMLDGLLGVGTENVKNVTDKLKKDLINAGISEAIASAVEKYWKKAGTYDNKHLVSEDEEAITFEEGAYTEFTGNLRRALRLIK